MNFSVLAERFERYTDTFRDAEGVLSEAMQLKYAHTMDVLHTAEEISRKESFPEHDDFLAKAGALFHDTARYLQIKMYNTFDDRASGFDHGHEGVREIYAHELLKDMDVMDQLTVVSAVELHNKAVVDYNRLDAVSAQCVKVTRDSDKLAILDMMIRILSGEIRIKDQNIVKLNRSDEPGFSPAIVNASINGTTPFHKDMRNLNDFVLTLFCWSADLHFAASGAIALEREYYDRLRRFLPQEPVVEQIYKITIDRLKCLSSK